MFRSRVVFYNKRFVCVVRNICGIYLLIEARQQKHCCLYDSRKCLEFLTASLLGRQPPIQRIFSLAAWGGAQPTLAMRCRPAARLLARAQGWQVFRSGVTICKKYFLGGNLNL